eukprot:3039638-Alexandrium_andersonii.AAC.1
MADCGLRQSGPRRALGGLRIALWAPCVAKMPVKGLLSEPSREPSNGVSLGAFSGRIQAIARNDHLPHVK